MSDVSCPVGSVHPIIHAVVHLAYHSQTFFCRIVVSWLIHRTVDHQ